jgi:hypothetical protein
LLKGEEGKNYNSKCVRERETERKERKSKKKENEVVRFNLVSLAHDMF